MIPKIIHYTAPTKELLWEERKLINRVKKIMPDYKIILHDDSDNEGIVKKYFPEYYDAYNNVNKGVAKADIARIMYMYIWGGWYCDTDYKWIKTPDKFADEICVMPMSRNENGLFRLGNAVFGSEPGVGVWKDFLEHIFDSNEITRLEESRIEKVTGPEGLTDFFVINKNRYNYICLPDRNVFHPSTGIFTAKTTDETIGIHLCWSSWRSGSLVKRLKHVLRRKITAII